MKNYKIFLIRHGEIKNDFKGKYIGNTDAPLSEKFEKELERNRNVFPTVDSVYSSPLLRAKRTASIIYPETPVKIIDGFAEMNFGIFENKSPEIILNSSDAVNYGKWLKNEIAPPNGESDTAFSARICKGFSRLVEEISSGNQKHRVAVVTHRGVISFILRGMGFPKLSAYEALTPYGKFWEINLDIALWQRAGIFEIVLS